jgi:hypothetical protein
MTLLSVTQSTNDKALTWGWRGVCRRWGHHSVSESREWRRLRWWVCSISVQREYKYCTVRNNCQLSGWWSRNSVHKLSASQRKPRTRRRESYCMALHQLWQYDLTLIVTISNEVLRKNGKLYLHSVLPELLLCQKVPPPILLELYPAKEDTINTSTDKVHLSKMYRKKYYFSCVFLQEIVNMTCNETLWRV